MQIDFLTTALLVAASPGSGAVYTVSAAIEAGRARGVLAAFGCTLGILPHMAAAMTGLAGLLRTAPFAFDMLAYAGAAYLLYMAWGLARAEGAMLPTGAGQAPVRLGLVMKAVFLNLLNPKLSILFFLFLPNFVPRDSASPLADMIGLSLVFMLVTFAVFLVYALIAARFSDRILSRPRALRRLRQAFALGYLALAASLAFSRG